MGCAPHVHSSACEHGQRRGSADKPVCGRRRRCMCMHACHGCFVVCILFLLLRLFALAQVVCHGIPGGMPDGLGREVRDGDVVSIDVSVYTQAGFFGDNCRTYLAGTWTSCSVCVHRSGRKKQWSALVESPRPARRCGSRFDRVFALGVCRAAILPRLVFLLACSGDASKADRGLVEHTRRAMWHGIRACRPGLPLSVIGNAIAHYCQKHCEFPPHCIGCCPATRP